MIRIVENGKSSGKFLLPNQSVIRFFIDKTFTQFACVNNRNLRDSAVKKLDDEFKEHEKNPEKHPLYPDEWKKFWTRRYKELQAGL